jgi:hypothetical protein
MFAGKSMMNWVQVHVSVRVCVLFLQGKIVAAKTAAVTIPTLAAFAAAAAHGRSPMSTVIAAYSAAGVTVMGIVVGVISAGGRHSRR